MFYDVHDWEEKWLPQLRYCAHFDKRTRRSERAPSSRLAGSFMRTVVSAQKAQFGGVRQKSSIDLWMRTPSRDVSVRFH